jgi:hypothetical protein
LNGVDKPALSMQRMTQLLRLVTAASHRSHAVNEIQYWLARLVAFEILEHLVAVLNGGNIVQWDVEEPVDVIVGMPGGHRSDDFVEMQIREATGSRVNTLRCAALWEQDAAKARHLSLACLLP